MKLARSVRSAVLALSIASLALGPPLARAQVRLPALGEGASEDFSTGTERKLGEQVMRDIVRDPDYLDDPVLLEYVESIFQPLVAAARARGDVEADVDAQFAWEVFLVRDRAVNAFALPGGWVGLYLGMIAASQTRDELASVLAHELSHITQRHIARGMAASQRQSMVAIAGLILAVLAASRSNNADAMNAAVMGSQALAIQGQLNFSRDMEREADRVGFAVLGSAGFSQTAMAAMFERLDSANRINDSGAYPYLRSHPLTTERMSEARSRNLLAAGPPNAGSLLHAFMQGRARVLMDTDPKNLRRLQEALTESGASAPRAPGVPERAAQLYAAAFASSLLRDAPHAQAAWREAQRLVAAAPPDAPLLAGATRELQLLQSQMQLAEGNAVAAMATLNAIGGDEGRAMLLLRSQAALAWQRQGGGEAAAQELRRNTEALQVWLSDHKLDAGAWNALSASAGAIGLRLRSMRAHAEARAAEGDLGGAIDRMRAAQAASRGANAGQEFIEASIIDSRLRDLTAQRRQLALEMRGQRGQHPDGGSDAPQLARAGHAAH